MKLRAVNTQIPEDDYEKLAELAHTESIEEGKRVSIASKIREAVKEFLED